MTPEQRAWFEFRLKELVWFLDRESLVRGGDWTFDCTLADGRRVKRTVTFYGYERRVPDRRRKDVNP